MGDERATRRWPAHLTVGRPLGVALRISPVWAGVMAAATVLYPGIAARLVPGIGGAGAYLMAFGLAVLLLGSQLVHQFGHAVACRAAGVAVRAVVLSLPGGAVEHGDPGTPRRAALVAAGGPAASLLLAGLCAALAVLSGGNATATALLGAIAVVNLAVTAFTLLPGLPMDGGKLVRAAVWAWTGSTDTGNRLAGRAGRVLAIVIAVLGLPLVRADDLAGSAVVSAAGLLVAAYVWHGAGAAAPRPASRAGTWLLAGTLSVVAMLLLRTFVVQGRVVASGSMDPTLRAGNRILVDKLSYLIGDVQPGDVVVLRRPPGVHGTQDMLVKRVIGVPGDRLEARAGRVFRNDVEVPEPYLPPGCPDRAEGLRPVVVPDRQVYVLGDNRCHSLDSRSFGPVDQELVEGRAMLVIWPVDRVSAI
jgi:signal peptidase I